MDWARILAYVIEHVHTGIWWRCNNKPRWPPILQTFVVFEARSASVDDLDHRTCPVRCHGNAERARAFDHPGGCGFKDVTEFADGG